MDKVSRLGCRQINGLGKRYFKMSGADSNEDDWG